MNGLAVLLQRGGPDELNFAPCQHGFEDAGRVNGALRRTRPRNNVQLVNEQNGGAIPVQLLQQIFEPFLKIAPVLGARHHGRHIQRQHPLALQALGHLPRRDALCQCLRQRAFAHARLPQQAGIVFLAAAQNLHHPLQLGLPAKHRVQLPLLCKTGQVPTIFLAGTAAAAHRHVGREGQHHLPRKLAAFPRRLRHLHAQLGQPDAGGAAPVLQHGAKQVFIFRSGRVGGVGAQNGKLHGLSGLRGKILPVQPPHPPGTAAAGGTFQQRRFRHLFAAEKFHRHAPSRLQHGHQKMAGIRRGAALPPCDGQRHAQRFGRGA